MRAADISRICRNGVRTAQDYTFIQGFQEDVAAALPPDEAEQMLWEANLYRLAPWQSSVRARLRMEAESEELLLTEAKARGYDPWLLLQVAREDAHNEGVVWCGVV